MLPAPSLALPYLAHSSFGGWQRCSRSVEGAAECPPVPQYVLFALSTVILQWGSDDKKVCQKVFPFTPGWWACLLLVVATTHGLALGCKPIRYPFGYAIARGTPLPHTSPLG